MLDIFAAVFMLLAFFFVIGIVRSFWFSAFPNDEFPNRLLNFFAGIACIVLTALCLLFLVYAHNQNVSHKDLSASVSSSQVSSSNPKPKDNSIIQKVICVRGPHVVPNTDGVISYAPVCQRVTIMDGNNALGY